MLLFLLGKIRVGSGGKERLGRVGGSALPSASVLSWRVRRVHVWRGPPARLATVGPPGDLNYCLTGVVDNVLESLVTTEEISLELEVGAVCIKVFVGVG